MSLINHTIKKAQRGLSAAKLFRELNLCATGKINREEEERGRRKFLDVFLDNRNILI